MTSCLFNFFGSICSSTMAGSCSLERTARDPEISRFPSCGSLHPLLLWVVLRLFPSIAAQDLVVLSSAWKTCHLLFLLPAVQVTVPFTSDATAQLPQGSCCQQPQGVTSDSWRLGCSGIHPLEHWLGVPKAAAVPGLVVPAHVSIAISAVLSRDACPYSHCGMFEWNAVCIYEWNIMCIYSFEMSLKLDFSRLLFKQKFISSVFCRST